MTVLLVSHDAGGTVPPMLALAEAFIAGGHDVAWLGQPSIERRATAAGSRFVPFTGIDDYARGTPIEEQLEIAGPLIAGPGPGDDVMTVAQELGVDLVVVDANLAGAAAAAEALDRPSAVLLHSMYATFTDTWFADYWPLLEAVINETRAHFGLAPCHSWPEVFAGHDRILSVVPKQFDAAVADPPASLRHFGFLVPASRGSRRDDAFRDGDEPTVVVGLSTTYQQQEDLLQNILDALGTLDVRGLVSTAGQVDPEALRCPPNVVLRDFVDHGAVLGATDIVVTHAGLGTVSAALSEAVPVVCTPIARDQHLNASRVAAVGAGVNVGSEAGAARIADAISDILADESYRSAAAHVAEQSRAAGGAPAAVADLRN